MKPSGKMVQIPTQELTGMALDWATGIAEGLTMELPGPRYKRTTLVWLKPFTITGKDGAVFEDKTYLPWMPSTAWDQLGPLLVKYNVWPRSSGISEEGKAYEAQSINPKRPGATLHYGSDPLTVACRAIVGQVLGDSVLIPVELCVPEAEKTSVN